MAAVFPDDWSGRIHLSSLSTYIDSNLTDAALLIDENQVDAAFWSNVQDGGGDLRCTTDAAGTTQIPIEVVLCNTTTEKLGLLIKRNLTSSGGDDVYLWYNASEVVTQPLPSSSYGSENVWDSDYVASFRCVEDSSDTTVLDSTSNDVDGTKFAASKPSANSSSKLYHQCHDYNGSDALVDLGNPAGLKFTEGHTIEFWMYVDTMTNFEAPLGYFEDTGNNESGYVPYLTGTGIRHWVSADDGVSPPNPGSGDQTGAEAFNTGEWVHIAVKYDGTTLKLRKNGIEEQSHTHKNGGNINWDYIGTNKAYLGVYKDSNEDNYYDGRLQEVRKSKVARSDDMLKLNYYNQNDTTNLWEVIPDEGHPHFYGLLRGGQ